MEIVIAAGRLICMAETAVDTISMSIEIEEIDIDSIEKRDVRPVRLKDFPVQEIDDIHTS